MVKRKPKLLGKRKSLSDAIAYAKRHKKKGEVIIIKGRKIALVKQSKALKKSFTRRF